MKQYQRKVHFKFIQREPTAGRAPFLTADHAKMNYLTGALKESSFYLCLLVFYYIHHRKPLSIQTLDENFVLWLNSDVVCAWPL